MNFSIIANIIVGMSEHPTLTVMLISKKNSSFFNFFLPLSIVETLIEHLIFNKVFNHKQVKMKKWEYPSNQKTTHGPPKKNGLLVA